MLVERKENQDERETEAINLITHLSRAMHDVRTLGI